jgi:hypothetical protein
MSNDAIQARFGAASAVRVVSAVANLSMRLSDLSDINNLTDVANGSILVYNSTTQQWDPYPYIDGGTY